VSLRRRLGGDYHLEGHLLKLEANNQGLTKMLVSLLLKLRLNPNADTEAILPDEDSMLGITQARCEEFHRIKTAGSARVQFITGKTGTWTKCLQARKRNTSRIVHSGVRPKRYARAAAVRRADAGYAWAESPSRRILE
jgi:hypothetical protein